MKHHEGENCRDDAERSATCDERGPHSSILMFCKRALNVFHNSRSLVRSFASLNGTGETSLLIGVDAVLARDFIKDCLYNKESGYNRTKTIGVLEKPIDFGSLWGRWEFNKTIKEVYDVRVLSYHSRIEAGGPLHEWRGTLHPVLFGGHRRIHSEEAQAGNAADGV